MRATRHFYLWQPVNHKASYYNFRYLLVRYWDFNPQLILMTSILLKWLCFFLSFFFEHLSTKYIVQWYTVAGHYLPLVATIRFDVKWKQYIFSNIPYRRFCRQSTNQCETAIFNWYVSYTSIDMSLNDGWIGGWMDGWMDWWMDVWVGGWTDGWILDRWTDRRTTYASANISIDNELACRILTNNHEVVL